MPKLPWLDDLIWLTPTRRQDTNGVLNRDSRNWRVGEVEDELDRFGLLQRFVLKPPRPTRRQMCARRMGYHEIERIGPVSKKLANIALIMPIPSVGTLGFRGQEIARHGIVASRHESVSNDP
jgi:hypothetical protein